MTDTTNDVELAEQMLLFGMNKEGQPLSNEERAVLEALVAEHQTETTAPAASSQVAESGETDLQALIQREIAKAMGGGGAQAPAQTQSFEDLVNSIDPRDSEAALAMFEWLSKNGRFGIVGTLNGGGYLLHYSEPKGTSKAGYTPGATQGGRMVDQAVATARASGAKARETGMCDKCWSAVEKHTGQDGSEVISLDGDPTSTVCSQGGSHTFNG